MAANSTDGARLEVPLSRRRDKPRLSCDFCRHRKTKCDREHPCGPCTKRGLALSCSYPTGTNPPTPSSTQGLRAPARSRPAAGVQGRIQHLESLVKELMDKTSSSNRHPSLQSQHEDATADEVHAPTPVSSVPDGVTPSDGGSVNVNEPSRSYISSAHWAAMLDDIAELKGHFEGQPPSPEAEEYRLSSSPMEAIPCVPSGPQLLYGAPPYATKSDVLSSLPPRHTVDRLISLYFNWFDMSPAVLHKVEFLREYERFWGNPDATPVVWVGLLFAAISLAAQFQNLTLGSNSESAEGESSASASERQAMVDVFKQGTMQCLNLGQYARGGPYVLETLILYFAHEVMLARGAETGLWVLVGTIVQLAVHMGYHRDPRHFPAMSPFEGEMRRRVWATVVDLDLGIAGQMGLPRLVKQRQADTQPPRNLLDADFDKTTLTLPPARAENEVTPILYRIVKARLISVLGQISDFTTETRPTVYAEVLKIDEKLETVRDSVPKCLRWQSLAHCIGDSPHAILGKMFMDILLCKGKLLLHRKHLAAPFSEPEFEYSRSACLEAAMRLLAHQQLLDDETRPLGQLYEARWKITTLLTHEFLLATSVLCYYVWRQRDASLRDATMGREVLGTVRTTLKKSYDIWMRSRSSSEAQKAATALRIVLSLGEDGDACRFKDSYSRMPHNLDAGVQTTSVPFDPMIPEAWAVHQDQHPTGSYLPYFQEVDGVDIGGTPEWSWSLI